MQPSPPPIQDATINQNNKFVQTWILWFQSVYKWITENRLGWAYYQDSQYTQASPRSISSGRTQLTIDTLGVVTNTQNLPVGVASWLSGNKFTPDSLNDAYVLRFDMTIVAGSPADQFILEIEVATGDVIYAQPFEINKSAGIRMNFSVAIPVWIGANFLANGGKFYLNTTHSFTIDTVGLYINKTYKA